MLDANPVQNTEALLRMGKQLLKQGQLDQAEAALRQVLQLEPRNAQALEFMGAVMLGRREAGKASGWLRRAIDFGGGSVPRYNNLGSALFLLNRLQEAVRAYEAAIDLDPDNVTALKGIGKCLIETGDFERAWGCFNRVEENDPEDLEALRLQINCLHSQDQPARAAQACERALALAPDDLQMQLYYGQMLSESNQHQEAVEVLERLLHEPEYKAAARHLLYDALFPLNEVGRVAELAWEALEEDPPPAQTRQMLARALNALGRSDEAQAQLETAIEEGNMGGGWLTLQGLRALTDDEVELVKRYYREASDEHKNYRGTLAFSVAEYHEKRKELDLQIEWLHMANELVGELRNHDPSRQQEYLESVRKRFTRETMTELAAGGDPDFEPVFILGLPRSGTTLLEQILGAHQALTPAGENPVTPWMFRQEGFNGKKDGIQAMTPELVSSLARHYREFMDARYTDGRIVEKGILNGREAGLLYCLFPNARFIEIRRHPLDVALGCYKQLFAGQDFSFNLDHIGAEVRWHERMMAHWHEQLPAPIHVVHYEELVTAQDAVTQEILDFLELPFDPGCLKFHENTTQVATASLNQVRKGVYSSAVGRWQKYGDLLDPFREALHRHGVSIPGEDDLDEQVESS